EEMGAWEACSVKTGVVREARHVTAGTGLHMATQGRRSALHNGARSSADVGGQGMRLLIRGKGVLEDRLERDKRHRCLRTRGRRRSSGCFLQYHANYPRCKRLVQKPLSEVKIGCTGVYHGAVGYRRIRMSSSQVVHASSR